MARALLGYVGSPKEHALAYEVAVLRRRVAELQSELDQLRTPDTETLEIELHRLAEESSPALA